MSDQAKTELQKQRDFLSENALEDVDEADLIFVDDDKKENSEHEEGDSTDDAAAAKISDDELASLDGQTPTPVVEQPVVPTPEATPPVEIPAAPTPPTEPASPAPTGEITPEQPAAPAVPVVEPPSDQSIASTYQEWKAAAENVLAEHHYALTPEVTAELEVEPAKVIPRLMAKTYLDAVTAATGQILMHMPRTVRLVMEQIKKNDETENTFFGRWPALKGHQEKVQQIGVTWRTNNLQASEEDFINEVGAIAMVSLRLDPTQGVQPAAPVVDTKHPPFVPSVGASPRTVTPTRAQGNVFEELGREFDEEFDDDN